MTNITPAQCTRECVKQGSDYALVSNGKVYTLKGDTKQIDKYAGQNVTVIGSISGEIVTVRSSPLRNRDATCLLQPRSHAADAGLIRKTCRHVGQRPTDNPVPQHFARHGGGDFLNEIWSRCTNSCFRIFEQSPDFGVGLAAQGSDE